MNKNKTMINNKSQNIEKNEYYNENNYLKEQERIFTNQKNSFDNFLPVEFFHWCGMDRAGERGILGIILEDNPEYINIKNRVEETGLMISSRLNLQDNVKVLIEHPDSDLSYYNENGNFLMYAISHNSKSVIKYVLDNHKSRIDFDCKTRINDSIFHLAARNANFRLWDEISTEEFEKYARQENKVGKNCLFLGVEAFFQYRDDIAFEALIRKFRKNDYDNPNSNGLTIRDFIRNEEKLLILNNRKTDFLGVMKLLMGIE